MTNRNALNYFLKRREYFDGVKDNFSETEKFVIEALEKQIPKKPICKKYTTDTKCPVCNTFVLIYNKYCIECGQAIDWSDTE